MIRCSTCGHSNLPSFTSCSKCGASLTAGGGPSPEYASLAAERAAKAKRNKMMMMVVGFGVLAIGGYAMIKDRQRKDALQVKLNFVDRWVEMDKRETGLFWNCVMASEVDINQFSAAAQIQQRIEAAYATQQKTFSEHLTTECVPKLERARQAMAAITDAPDELKAPLEAYNASLPKLGTNIELYAQRIKNRGGTKDMDQLIQEYGNAWHAEQKPTPETIAYDKFLGCAIPGLEKMKDAQVMLEYLADQCFKKDPVAFMDRVRKDCGPMLQNTDAKAAPSKNYKATQKRLYEEEARQLQAWDSCGRRARKGKKVEDLGEFLVSVGEYMKARANVGQTARELAK